jgi:hypothetical protein
MVVRTKQDAARMLSEIEGDKRFYCNDGCIICNLHQLAECLAHMNDDSFGYHVTTEKNDFSRWIGDVVGDEKLARDISGVVNRLEAAEMVKTRVTWLKAKMQK